MILDHHSGACHGCRNAACVNCRPICLLWSLNKHCPLPKIQTARPTIEIKSSMGGNPHNGFVRKTQLSARTLAGSHNSLLMDDVAYRSPMRGVLRICQLNVIFYSRDPRFVSRSGVQPAGEPSRNDAMIAMKARRRSWRFMDTLVE